jgi:hypothetical protein
VPRGRIELSVLVLAAVVFALGVLWLRSRDAQGLVAYDFYGQFYPYLVHAGRSLRAGGGLLWNPYQDCGQPFFGNSQTGLLYPGNLLFALLPREPALLASVVVHLTIAGAGVFALCRAMLVGRAAALCGALAFQLGWAATNMAAWSPTHMAPFAWLPVAMWGTERLIRAPSLRGGLVLAVVLALQLLPGFPQTAFFTYQLIALRVGWALLLRQTSDVRALLRAVVLALVLPLFLDAVQLLPAMEVARLSVRGGALGASQLGPGFSWGALLHGAAVHVAIPGNALVMLLAILGVAAAPRLRKTADAAFYALIVMLYFVLSLGPGSILFGLYARLPLGSMFRGSDRLLWLTSFGVSVLVALGCDALFAGARRGPRSRIVLAGCLLAGGLGLCAIAGNGVRPIDALMLVVLVALTLAPIVPRLVPFAPLALPALLVCNALVAARPPLFGLRQGDVYREHADVFDFVRARLTPQDRVLIVGGQPALALMPKSATLFAIPDVHDYDVLASQRYAEYFTFLRTARPMRDFEDWYWIFTELLPATLQRPLFDLTAARYLIVAASLDTTPQAFAGDLPLLLDRDGVRVYENERAIPRARFVGRVVVRRESEVLRALADPSIDARRVAVVSDADRSALHGLGGDGTGTVEFSLDEPEHVVLRVHSTAPGFLLLADEYFPGWTATVNGEAREIVRANHTFRLVEVPAGDSEVSFRYRPLSLRVGALLSLAAGVIFVLLWRRGRPAR